MARENICATNQATTDYHGYRYKYSTGYQLLTMRAHIYLRVFQLLQRVHFELEHMSTPIGIKIYYPSCICP